MAFEADESAGRFTHLLCIKQIVRLCTSQTACTIYTQLRNLEEFLAPFTHYNLNFGLPPKCSLALNPDKKEGQKWVLPSFKSEKIHIKLLIGVHVGSTSQVQDLELLLNALPRDSTVLLLVDGVELLDSNLELLCYLEKLHLCGPIEEMKRHATALNLAEKNSARDFLQETDCAIVYEPIGNEDLLQVENENRTQPLFISAIKPRERGKLHSHLWLFNGFAQYFKPTCVAIVDVEVTPELNAFSLLVSRVSPVNASVSSDNASLVATSSLVGAFGELVVSRENRLSTSKVETSILTIMKLWDWFETRYSQIMYTPIENVGGYVSPPAISFVVYNWEALRENENVLRAYFKPFTSPHDLSWLDSNLYEHLPSLFLCLEARLNASQPGKFSFEKNAKGTWKTPTDLIGWIDYKARVINANFLSFLKTIAYTEKFCKKCDRNCCRTFSVICEFYYFAVAFVFKWLAISTYYVLSSMAIRKVIDSTNGYYTVWKYCYLLTIAVTFFLSLGKQGTTVRYIWIFILALNVLQSFVNLGIFIWDVLFNGSKDEESALSFTAIAQVILVVGSFLVAPVIYGQDRLKFILCGGLYVIILPVYTNVLGVYALCNTSDDCWGTSISIESIKRDSLRAVYSVSKNIFIILYLITNLVFGVLWEQLDIIGDSNNTSTKVQSRWVFVGFYCAGLVLISLPMCCLQVFLAVLNRCIRGKTSQSPASFDRNNKSSAS